ncbi:hypothetical protein SDC9_49586 [bioreactor metagenome]|uniref:ASCH domain-containing protein n=1 Tax=bioreactor metagenome TaxID=1076179 RepID=A0A644WII8_9ZZZZ|nr:ASCH domain-containing protein [Macellibacteroides fermentans]
MKVLQLIIKQQYFDEILAGTKKQEFREVKPTTSSKYITYVDEKGNRYLKDSDIPDDVEVDIDVIKYDAIQFFVGYHSDRDSALVEVLNSEFEIFVDENDQEITYEYKGETYIEAQMVYSLGRVIEKSVK